MMSTTQQAIRSRKRARKDRRYSPARTQKDASAIISIKKKSKRK